MLLLCYGFQSSFKKRGYQWAFKEILERRRMQELSNLEDYLNLTAAVIFSNSNYIDIIKICQHTIWHSLPFSYSASQMHNQPPHSTRPPSPPVSNPLVRDSPSRPPSGQHMKTTGPEDFHATTATHSKEISLAPRHYPFCASATQKLLPGHTTIFKLNTPPSLF